MPAAPLEGLVRHLRDAASLRDGPTAEDDVPLERFLADRDPRAFEWLVRRHGPMVLAVCKRILGNQADAEDAFQATFLVLVRKAGSILPRNQVGNWLHGVAHKTALKARAMDARRRVKEREAARGRDGSHDARHPLLEVLDGELRALPEKYRVPIILCDLEGLSYREAAARLRCPAGTLSGRLTRARALLGRRLSRRAVALTTPTLAALLARDAAGSVPPSLTARTVRAGTALADGGALADGVASPKVVSLTKGVLTMSMFRRFKVLAGVVLVVAAALAAGWMYVSRVSADDARAPARQTPSSATPALPREAEFVFRGVEDNGKAVSLVVAGTTAPVLSLPVKEDLRVLAAGRQLAIDDLRPGALVTIRLDPTNREIRDMRAVGPADLLAVLKAAGDAARREPPSNAEVLRALPKPDRTIPPGLEVSRDDVAIVTERLVTQVDPPRFYPGVGTAELHRCHWKCTVSYVETLDPGDPEAGLVKRPRVEVVYIDKDYLVPTK